MFRCLPPAKDVTYTLIANTNILETKLITQYIYHPTPPWPNLAHNRVQIITEESSHQNANFQFNIFAIPEPMPAQKRLYSCTFNFNSRFF